MTPCKDVKLQWKTVVLHTMEDADNVKDEDFYCLRCDVFDKKGVLRNTAYSTPVIPGHPWRINAVCIEDEDPEGLLIGKLLKYGVTDLGTVVRFSRGIYGSDGRLLKYRERSFKLNEKSTTWPNYGPKAYKIFTLLRSAGPETDGRWDPTRPS